MEKRDKVHGVRGFYLTAFLCLLVSADTSWRFFGEVLGIVDIRERVIMFAVLEIGLLACAVGMRANIFWYATPGAPRYFAWVLCAVSGYMALLVSGPVQGLARVILGPVLGLVMLHLALGIEVRARASESTTMARIVRELRERALSRLGLGDDARDAATRTRDRAARRAARLALAKRAPFRAWRLSRALRLSGVSADRHLRSRMLAELATLRHADALAELDQASPWTAQAPATQAPTPKTETVTKPLPPALQPVPIEKRSRAPRSGRTDKELIEDLRAMIADTEGEIGKRAVMRALRVGSDRALVLLHAVRNEETGS